MMSFISKTLKPIVGAATLAAIAVSIPTQAQALSFTFTGGQTTVESGATTIDFEARPLNSVSNFTEGLATYAGKGRIVQGTVANRYRQPTGDNTQYLTIGEFREPGPVTISLAGLSDYFGLYWGSIDTHNSIAFYRGDTLVKGFGKAPGFTSISTLFTGVIPPGQFGVTSQYTNFFAEDPSEWFNKIVLSSSMVAFESDNHAYRVIPTPALAPAAIGFGVAMLRKRKKSEQGKTEAKA